MALGHEIGVHNNAIAQSLRTGRPPAVSLGEALDALRRHGLVITGTAAHGDGLARRLGFLNNEMFLECPNPDAGRPTRTLAYPDPRTHRTTSLKLEPVPMADLGLDYEAYSRDGLPLGCRGSLESAARRGRRGLRTGAPFSRSSAIRSLGPEGELIRPLPVARAPQPVDPSVPIRAPPFDVLVRSDCCRRAINMNRDLFRATRSWSG